MGDSWRRFLCILVGHRWICVHMTGGSSMARFRFVAENARVRCGRCEKSCVARIEERGEFLVAVPAHWPELLP
jgi:hypothetical protein